MLPGDALEVLGLGPSATAAEIKEAYRDLVKVWHPDRFASDVRLRRKAEEKLQQINDAYRVLQSNRDPVRVYSSGSKPADTSERQVVQPRKVWGQKRAVSKGDVFLWAIAGSGIAVVMVTAIIAFHYRSQPAVPPQVVQEMQGQERTGKSSDADASPRTEPQVSSGKTNHLNRAGTPSFQVRQLSDSETARVESACQGEKERDPSKYQDCVRAQLGGSEPEMSTLSPEDRSGIQSACKKTKSREGLAAYNRCLTRMVRLLEESTRRRGVE